MDVGQHLDPGRDALVALPRRERREHVAFGEGHRFDVADHREVDDRPEYLLLGAEARVHGLDRDARPLGDRRHGGARPARLLEQARSRGQHLGPGLAAPDAARRVDE